MPLLPRRRSTLDLLKADLRNNISQGDDVNKSTSALPEPPRSPQRPVSGYEWPDHGQDGRAESPPLQEPTPATRRFSMLKFRHFSDTQLATRARLQAERDAAPPVPALPNGKAIMFFLR